MRTKLIAASAVLMLLAVACSSATPTPSAAGPSPGTTTAPATSGASTGSGGSAAPGTTQGPGATQGPGTTEGPGTTQEPGTTEGPGATQEPGTTEGPGTTAEPTTNPSVKPPTNAGFQAGKVNLDLKKVIDGLPAPVYVTGTGDHTGRLFVVERAGRIRILDPDKGSLKPFLDIRSRVDTFNERGLHSIALHPNYEKNGRFFVHYNAHNGDTMIVEFRGKPGGGEVNPNSGRTILHISRPYSNHNGGWIGFGKDGYLYISSGDGGGDAPGDPFRNGQDRGDLLGSILRIDVDGRKPYAIPPDNPFAHGGGRRELWNYGLRNPWRDSFDRKTGNLWIGDVGQDSQEEVDVQPEGKGGLNFGWSEVEGTLCHRSSDCSKGRYVAPVTSYSHAQGCTVIGGYVYRGSAYPILEGGYLFADYCSGNIWAIPADKGKAGADLQPKKLFSTSSSAFVSFGEDDEGELYIVSIGGAIYRITATQKG